MPGVVLVSMNWRQSIDPAEDKQLDLIWERLLFSKVRSAVLDRVIQRLQDNFRHFCRICVAHDLIYGLNNLVGAEFLILFDLTGFFAQVELFLEHFTAEDSWRSKIDVGEIVDEDMELRLGASHSNLEQEQRVLTRLAIVGEVTAKDSDGFDKACEPQRCFNSLHDK